jgi:hypothetical protein
VYHLWWIPLVPLGFWKHWRCTACSGSPAYNPRSRRKFALTLAALAAACTLLFWTVPIESPRPPWWPFVGQMGPVVIVAALIWAAVAERTPSTAERLASVAPAHDTVCPFCRGVLATHNWKCVNCNVQRK